MKTVVSEETGEERLIVGYCQVCGASPDKWPPVIVSPQGLVHESNGGDSTACGKDATRERWWWAA